MVGDKGGNAMGIIREEIVVNTKQGKIVKNEDLMFGGWQYIVLSPDGNCVLKTFSFDRAMQKLEEV